MKKINIKDVDIHVKEINDRSYVSLTDIAKLKNNKQPWRIIQNWLRQKATFHYVMEWEEINNFKPLHLEWFKSDKRSTSWVQNPSLLGITIEHGKYSKGAFADIDIALEFARSISPIFALYVNTEFLRLKKAEQNIIPWNPVEDIKKIPMTLEVATIKYKKSTVCTGLIGIVWER